LRNRPSVSRSRASKASLACSSLYVTHETATEQGQQLYDHARRILQEIDDAKGILRSQTSDPTGRVSVGLPTSACRGLSLPLFRVMVERLPNITLHLVEAMTGYLDELIQAGRLDVALLYDHKAFEHVAWTQMITEDLMLFVSAKSPMAKRRSISFRKVFDFPVVLPGRPNVLRIVIEQLAARHDIVPNVKDYDSLPAIAKLVCDAQFMAVMPHFAFVDEMARGEMVAIPIVDPMPSWTLSVVVSQRTMHSRASEAVARMMADLIGDMVKRGTWRAKLRAAKMVPD